MTKAIEVDFPFEQLDPVAELESWRKEINRPLYYIHKWWARRLGSVLRAILLGATSEVDEDIWQKFYRPHDLKDKKDKIVLDPFMGSGTTLGECAKLGIKAIGCDINPVSTFMVRQVLTRVELREIKQTYHEIQRDVQHEISQYYKTIDPNSWDGAQLCDVLYYFWVKVVKTPFGEEVPLFSKYVFSKNVYPKKKPKAQILCAACWAINEGRYDATTLSCYACGHTFNPQVGPAKRQKVTDKAGREYKIKELINASQKPPEQRIYVMLALTNNGQKVYLAPKRFDFELYEQASLHLAEASLPLPDMVIREGYNTNQVRGYNYLNWRHFFNDRQLLCLGILLKRILAIPETTIREMFLCLFSGCLEFNNMFCSFKGEGTGAVRHLFSNHILKPEKMPLENNVWGTAKSSGGFSTLYTSRLLRAKEYLLKPYEIKPLPSNGRRSARIYGPPIETSLTDNYQIFKRNGCTSLVLNGDSGRLPLPDASVDAVVTDPPYFDFVHYSELSDFFFAWLAPLLSSDYPYFDKENSGDKREVQHRSAETFAKNLGRVFKESYRTLKDDGLLIFSFHHSKPAGWLAIYQAIVKAGFEIVAAHPVKAEMSVAKPKSAARSPINLDAILVCKKGSLPMLFGDPMSSDNYLELLLAQQEGTDTHRALFG